MRSSAGPKRLPYVHAVRINSVRFGVLILWLFAAGLAIQGQDPPRLEQALSQIASHASQFWHSAPGYTARETLQQKAIVPSRRRLRIGQAALEPPKPAFRDREIVSYYGFSSYKAAPEALHEFRRVISIDGKPRADAAAARAGLQNVLLSSDDRKKRSLLEEFQKDGLGSAAIDFGQLILLFTRSNLPKYSFELAAEGMVGADRALIITFRQLAGNDSLHISEAGKNIRRPLQGELRLRESDLLPLRVALTSEHDEAGLPIRDNATVEYTPSPSGLILPAAVAYRRYVNDQLRVENVYQYSDWQPVSEK